MTPYEPSEGDWQCAVKNYLNRPFSRFRVHRQNAGTWEVKGYFIHGAPEGSCDLVGIVRHSGRYLGIECKGYPDNTSKARRKKQRARHRFINSWGGIALESKPKRHLTKEQNLQELEAELLRIEAERMAA